MTAISAARLWEQVRDCFTYDDGSLPTIEIYNLTQEEVGDLYGATREGTRIASEEAMFWDLTSEQERHLDEVGNAGALVAAGKAAPFHFAIDGLGGPGCSVPCIGVHVFQDSIALDYRMGKDWGKKEVWCFFVWLRDLMSRTSAGMIRLGDERPPAGDTLIAALGAFLQKAEV
jgi:hypothetical protein